jgi:NADPH:quinone reductase-like Zn-dependent oxidoreductase
MRVHRGTPNDRKHMARLTEMIEAGEVRPVIDKRCGLGQVAEALTYVEQGHAGGKVVIAIDGTEEVV